jgi:transcription termination/antitermination protein NusG
VTGGPVPGPPTASSLERSCGSGPRNRPAEGGEALTPTTLIESQPLPRVDRLPSPAATPTAAWYVLWTRSNCEQLVCDQLAAKGFHLFLPTMEAWVRRGGRRSLGPVPMFPGYVFLNHTLDKWSDVEVRKARGLVGILGNCWNERAVVPDAEVNAIRRVVDIQVPVMVHPYLRQGQRVRIVRGPLTNVEGLLVRTKPTKGLLVLSVDLLHRSVAVEVDCTLAVPV